MEILFVSMPGGEFSIYAHSHLTSAPYAPMINTLKVEYHGKEKGFFSLCRLPLKELHLREENRRSQSDGIEEILPPLW